MNQCTNEVDVYASADTVESFIAQELKAAVEDVQLKALKTHHCAFNDGECNCPCFVEAIKDLESAKANVLKELGIE